jgi:hypothetical protein
MVVFIAPYWRASGGDFMKAYFAAIQALRTGRPNTVEVALFLPLTAGLIWFTYFSRSRVVKDHDKFAVFLMLCGAAVGWVLMLVRFFSRQ